MKEELITQCVCGARYPDGYAYDEKGISVLCADCGRMLYMKPMSELKKKKGILKRIWDKTIFSEMIEDKKMKRKIKQEAKREAMEEMKDDLKKAYKEKEISKITGKGKKEGKKKSMSEKLETFGKMFNTGDMFSDEKMDRMLGNTGRDVGGSQAQSNGGVSDDKISRILGTQKTESPKMGKKRGKKRKKKSEEPQESAEDRVNRILYG